MKKQEFLSILAVEFNVSNDSLSETSVLEEIPGWDSMSILVIMSMVDERFGLILTANDFVEIKTIGELFTKIGPEHIK
jgi:acyl carrier protein